VLVVGNEPSLDPRLGAAIKRLGLHPVLSVPDPTTAYEVAAASSFDLVLVDFEGLGDEAELASDMLRAVMPTCWVLDFRGIVRRRPDHASVSMAHTRPLVLV
jgi:2-keto-3-deoxy-L-rhamnonate aldolase RhmA